MNIKRATGTLAFLLVPVVLLFNSWRETEELVKAAAIGWGVGVPLGYSRGAFIETLYVRRCDTLWSRLVATVLVPLIAAIGGYFVFRSHNEDLALVAVGLVPTYSGGALLPLEQLARWIRTGNSSSDAE